MLVQQSNQTTYTNLELTKTYKKQGEKEWTLQFSNGQIFKGPMPYSELSLYVYNVRVHKQRYSDSIIEEIIPKRLPLNLKRLSILLNATSITDFDIEELLLDSSKFDTADDAPDQLPNVIQYFPELIKSLEQYTEGILYIYFDGLAPVSRFYPPELLADVPPRKLIKLGLTTTRNPIYLCFKITHPFKKLRELTSKEYDQLVEITGYNHTLAERIAIDLYHKWLKEDLKKGHTFSPISEASKHVIGSNKGLEYLKENNIISIENSKDVFLTEVLVLEESIRQSFEELKRRRDQAEGHIPLRDHQANPYAKQKDLVTLHEEQAEALELLKDNAVAILTGKPGNRKNLVCQFDKGTGKTTVLSHLVCQYDAGAVIGVAPTNRASREVIRRVTEAKTIHRVIYELMTGQPGFDLSKIYAVIADESSMITLHMAACLLDLLIKNCPNLQRFYFVGDPDQLEPIGAGRVLEQLVHFLPCATLSINHRVHPAAVLINENAIKVRNQNKNIVPDDEYFIIQPPTGSIYEDISLALSAAGLYAWNTHTLSPYRKEAREINSLVKQIFTKRPCYGNVFEVGDKIMCTKNYHATNIINGDFFKIVEIHIMMQNKDSPIFIKKVDSTHRKIDSYQFIRLVVIPAPVTQEEYLKMETFPRMNIDTTAVPLSSFTLGYSTTNHKFQGCEADNIIFYMPTHTWFINWKHVYTAITRAKRRVILITTMQELQKAIEAKVYPKRNRLIPHIIQKNSLLVYPPGIEQDARDVQEISNLLGEEQDEDAPPPSSNKEGNEKRKTPDNNSNNGFKRFKQY